MGAVAAGVSAPVLQQRDVNVSSGPPRAATAAFEHTMATRCRIPNYTPRTRVQYPPSPLILFAPKPSVCGANRRGRGPKITDQTRDHPRCGDQEDEAPDRSADPVHGNMIPNSRGLTPGRPSHWPRLRARLRADFRGTPFDR